MRKILMPFFMLGDCSDKETLEMIEGAVEAGADYLELGIPHSDPLADGPVLREAAERAIRNGMTPHKAIKLAGMIKTRFDCPVYILTYLNTLYGYEVEVFIQDVVRAGIDGLIIPDLPLEAQQNLKEEYDFKNLTVAAFTSPTSEERLESIVKDSDGLIYSVNYAGITGSGSGIDDRVKRNYEKLKQFTDRPVLSGFGIGTAQSARNAVYYSDGVIIGTQLREIYETSENKGADIKLYLESIRDAID